MTTTLHATEHIVSHLDTIRRSATDRFVLTDTEVINRYGNKVRAVVEVTTHHDTSRKAYVHSAYRATLDGSFISMNLMETIAPEAVRTSTPAGRYSAAKFEAAHKEFVAKVQAEHMDALTTWAAAQDMSDR